MRLGPRSLLVALGAAALFVGLARGAFAQGSNTCQMWLTRQRPIGGGPWVVTSASCLGTCPDRNGTEGTCVEYTQASWEDGSGVHENRTCYCMYQHSPTWTEYVIWVVQLPDQSTQIRCDGRKRYNNSVLDLSNSNCAYSCNSPAVCTILVTDHFVDVPPGYVSETYYCDCQ